MAGIMKSVLRSVFQKESHSSEQPPATNYVPNFHPDTYHSQDSNTKLPVSSDGPQQQQPVQQLSWFTRLTLRWWLLEILSILASFASIAAIVIVLAKYALCSGDIVSTPY
jgi:hypothetical protein